MFSIHMRTTFRISDLEIDDRRKISSYLTSETNSFIILSLKYNEEIKHCKRKKVPVLHALRDSCCFMSHVCDLEIVIESFFSFLMYEKFSKFKCVQKIPFQLRNEYFV